jgi:hypothetical protein|tara:strand:- start:606 stop:719 length:114 start_codon:yes stop_codon:yes gene_type:complete
MSKIELHTEHSMFGKSNSGEGEVEAGAFWAFLPLRED